MKTQEEKPLTAKEKEKEKEKEKKEKENKEKWEQTWQFLFLLFIPPLILWVLWNFCGLGERFFGFLPEKYHHIGYWETLGLLVMIRIFVKFAFTRFTDNKFHVETKEIKS